MTSIYGKKPLCDCPRCKPRPHKDRRPRIESAKILKLLDRLELQINRLLKGENYVDN